MRTKRMVGFFLTLSMTLCLIMGLWDGSFARAEAQESALHRIQRTGVIRVGWALWRPWMVMDQNTKQLSGIGPDLIAVLAKELGDVKIEWVADNWATLPAGLQSGKFDITYPLGITLPRAMVCDFSDPTMLEAQVLLINKKDKARFKSLKDLNKPGIKIAVGLGTNTDMYLTKAFDQSEIVRLKSSPESTMALVLGKVVAAANTGSNVKSIMAEHKDTTVVPGYYGLGKNSFAIRQGDQVFLNWLNNFVAEMKDTKVLDRIFEKYGSKREIFFD